MPTGLRNVVCDECFGGRMIYLPTGEIQLEHKVGCPHKWREDSFLIQLAQGLHDKNPDGPTGMGVYPDVKLNPEIYDLLCDGRFTEYGNKTFAKGERESKAQKRAHRINDNFQLVRQALIEDGRWKGILENMKAVREYKKSHKSYY